MNEWQPPFVISNHHNYAFWMFQLGLLKKELPTDEWVELVTTIRMNHWENTVIPVITKPHPPPPSPHLGHLFVNENLIPLICSSPSPPSARKYIPLRLQAYPFVNTVKSDIPVILYHILYHPTPDVTYCLDKITFTDQLEQLGNGTMVFLFVCWFVVFFFFCFFFLSCQIL